MQFGSFSCVVLSLTLYEYHLNHPVITPLSPRNHPLLCCIWLVVCSIFLCIMEREKRIKFYKKLQKIISTIAYMKNYSYLCTLILWGYPFCPKNQHNNI